MFDVTIIGGGAAAASCSDVLTRAGFNVSTHLRARARRPQPRHPRRGQRRLPIARQAVERGRHLLHRQPRSSSRPSGSRLPAGRPASVLRPSSSGASAATTPATASSAASWKPTPPGARATCASETLSLEAPTTAIFRWRTLDAVGLASASPAYASRSSSPPAPRQHQAQLARPAHPGDHLPRPATPSSRSVSAKPWSVARPCSPPPTRKAFVDELNQTTPVRLVDDEPGSSPGQRPLALLPIARRRRAGAPAVPRLPRRQLQAEARAGRSDDLAPQPGRHGRHGALPQPARRLRPGPGAGRSRRPHPPPRHPQRRLTPLAVAWAIPPPARLPVCPGARADGEEAPSAAKQNGGSREPPLA